MTILLPAGNALTVTGDAFFTGTVRRLDDAFGSAYAPASLAASSVTTIGPFSTDRRYEVLAATGGFTYAVAPADFDPHAPLCDTISEQTADAGVTVDGVLLKDGAVTALQPLAAYAVDGAIVIAPGLVKLTKSSSAGAYTLDAPTAAQEGTTLIITSTTAKAHVITATGLLNDGVTGGAKNLATFAAFAGATITLIAVALKWHVVSLNAVTVSAS